MKLLLTIISWFLNRLPQRVVLWLGDGVGAIWYWLIPVRRSLVLEHLRGAFGQEKSERELRQLARRNFRHYGRCLLEMLQSICWKAEDYRRRTRIHGLENASRFYDRGEGGFFLTLHLGNWEVLVGAGAAYGIPVDIVVKHARSPFFESLLQWYRDRLGVGVFLESGTAKDILRSVSRGRFVGFILDQFMGPPIGLPVKFFGRSAGTTVSLALLAEKTETPVIPAYCYRDEHGVLHTVIEPPMTLPSLPENRPENKNLRLHLLTQAYNDVLERVIRKHPEQWLWLHRRWKPFRGETKWPLPNFTTPALALLTALVLGIGACTTTPPTPTGIELPPDPEIAVPEFKDNTSSFEESELTEKPESSRPPVVVESKPEKKKKTMEKEVKKTPGETAPAASFEAVPAYKIPFQVGERIEIDMGWMGLPAGTAVMEVREGLPFRNRPTYHLWGNVLSSKLVDAIYHVDNTAESFVDATGLIPYKFLLHMVETAQKKETRVSFDHLQKKAFYWSKRLSQKWGDENIDRTDSLVPGAKDLWSGIYYARTLNYRLNQKQEVYIYENGQNYRVELLPMGREMVRSKLGAFQCIKIKVTITLDNVLKPTGDVFMWLSDDSKRYLVKFEAKIKIGSLYGNLAAIREKK